MIAIRYIFCSAMAKIYSLMKDYTRDFKKRPYYDTRSIFYNVAAQGHYAALMDEPFVMK